MSFRTLMIAGMACLVGVPLFAQNDLAKKIFEQRDSDKNGYLTPNEAKEIPDLFNRLVKLGDSDEDGKLSFEEFSNGLKSVQAPQPSDAKQPDEPTQRRFAPDRAEFFTRLDRDGDGKLTRSELPEPLKERFEPVFEKAGKESLTQEEFTSAMSEAFAQPGRANPLGERPPRDEPGLKEFFDRMDQNQDGTVTADEIPERARPRFAPLFEQLGKESFTLDDYSKFAATIQQPRRPGDDGGQRPGRFAGAPDGQPRGPAFFSMLDKDQNGKLSPTELAFAVTLIEQLDRNEDGELDAGELMGFRPGMRGPGGRPETDAARPARPRRPEGAGNPERPGEPAGDDFAKRFFERFDTDSDGFISKSEAPERMAENFGNLDQNKDDKLSLEEFQSSVGPRDRRPND